MEINIKKASSAVKCIFFLLTRQIMWAFYTSQQFSETLRGVKSDAHAQTAAWD